MTDYVMVPREVVVRTNMLLLQGDPDNGQERFAVVKELRASLEGASDDIRDYFAGMALGRIAELEAYNATRTDELLAATRRIAELERQNLLFMGELAFLTRNA